MLALFPVWCLSYSHPPTQSHFVSQPDDFPVAPMVKNPPANAGHTKVVGSVPGSGTSSGGGHATHSSILARKIPGTGESDGLQSIGPQRVGHNWVTEHKTYTNLLIIIKKKYTFLLIRFNSRCLDGTKKEHNNMLHVSLHVILQTSCGNSVCACMCLYIFIYIYIQREGENICLYICVCI